MRDAIAIIPARGGSKRIPDKNILEVNGKPMIAWTIHAAIESGQFAHVVVSTESEKIAAVATAHGAEVPFLRDAFFDDDSPVSVATASALEQAEAHYGRGFKTVAQLMANCPLRDAQDIVRACAAFTAHARQFQISCFKFGWMNPWWACELDADGTPSKLFPEALKQRSQDLPDLYCPTGAIWIADAAALKAQQSFYGAGHKFAEMAWESALDVDDYDDLRLVESVFARQERQR